MPSIEENRGWARAESWERHGEEWSSGWGSTALFWQGTMLPRIVRFLPADHILEIACGHGRCTAMLLNHCMSLTGVDLVPECAEYCRSRFAHDPRARFFANDGMHLPMVESATIDFAFSWDSLVHCERDVMASYVLELARVLRPGAHAFLHHSNLGAFADPVTGENPVKRQHWRARSVSAEHVQQLARDAGLHCLAQELIPWDREERAMTDAFTLLRRPADARDPAPPLRTTSHAGFGVEIDNLFRIGKIYGDS